MKIQAMSTSAWRMNAWAHPDGEKVPAAEITGLIWSLV